MRINWPSSQRPNSNFVSAMMIPAAGRSPPATSVGWLSPAALSGRLPADDFDHPRERNVFIVARFGLRGGREYGRIQLGALCMPAGSGCRRPSPFADTPSSGRREVPPRHTQRSATSVFHARLARPARHARSAPAADSSPQGLLRSGDGARRSWPNQNAATWVRTRPLSGIPEGKTQSKRLIRSVLTRSSRSWSRRHIAQPCRGERTCQSRSATPPVCSSARSLLPRRYSALGSGEPVRRGGRRRG